MGGIVEACSPLSIPVLPTFSWKCETTLWKSAFFENFWRQIPPQAMMPLLTHGTTNMGTVIFNGCNRRTYRCTHPVTRLLWTSIHIYKRKPMAIQHVWVLGFNFIRFKIQNASQCYCRYVCSLQGRARQAASSSSAWAGGRFKNAYELLNLRALQISMLYKNHIFQCMGMIFCVEFQRLPLKFHIRYLTHTLKDVDFIHRWKFKSS